MVKDMGSGNNFYETPILSWLWYPEQEGGINHCVRWGRNDRGTRDKEVMVNFYDNQLLPRFGAAPERSHDRTQRSPDTRHRRRRHS